MHVPELKDKVVIVTGSARGIGQAIAERFATEGSSVVLADLDNVGIESVAEKIITDGGSAVPIATDVAIEEQVDALFDTALNEYGTVDVLVNNAGLISPVKHILEVDKAWWDRLIGANLTGTFLCARRAAHIMARKGEGSIINMSSGGATKAHRAFVAYDASKGGIEAMTRALALTLDLTAYVLTVWYRGSLTPTGPVRKFEKNRARLCRWAVWVKLLTWLAVLCF